MHVSRSGGSIDWVVLSAKLWHFPKLLQGNLAIYHVWHSFGAHLWCDENIHRYIISLVDFYIPCWRRRGKLDSCSHSSLETGSKCINLVTELKMQNTSVMYKMDIYEVDMKFIRCIMYEIDISPCLLVLISVFVKFWTCLKRYIKMNK